ncbi:MULTISPECIES: 4-fold beta flower protein [Asticcacaulis]|uniref:4-fold beta flower protein n=1 Tax=Asticcacaulis TaxID=76890 RepID=UPI001AE4DCB0|nr:MULTISPECIES: hypothetical protein [Asticcacaulis]MBP2159579.1 hypothetical protein [Asticcacaulis solisilvae]MDR6800594.1 hypothetical protein [Asticcacaulis sp. BE141]
MKIMSGFMLAVLALFSAQTAQAADEISLFNGTGEATAYIAVDDGLTIYTWNGKPVAYLDPVQSGGFNIYGFNGYHLGWFSDGVVWDHNGDAACSVKERQGTTQFEPFKSFKEFKPFKSFKEFAPYKPTLSNSFGTQPCSLLLARGAS